MQRVALVFFVIVFARSGFGDPISFIISNPAVDASPGTTAIFSGTITNDSGLDLDTTDFFVNAFGFDPTVLSIQQILGTTDVLIPDGTTSPMLDLFSISVAITAPANTSYPASVFIEDIDSDQTSALGVSIDTSSISAVPEPRMAPVLGICLGTLLGLFRRRKTLMHGTEQPSCTLATGDRAPIQCAASATLLVTLAFACGTSLSAQTPMISTGTPTLMLADANDLTVSIPLANSGGAGATRVQVTYATLAGTTLSSSLPLNLGTLSPAASSVVALSFSSAAFSPGGKSLLTISGSYSLGLSVLGFTVNRFVTIPPLGVLQPQPPASCRCTVNCISLQITSPVSGSAVSQSAITVTGTVLDSADEVGVVINGISALVQNGQFQAAKIPVSLGSNTVTATASDSCLHQATATTQVMVSTQTPPLVTVTAGLRSGVAPLAVSFTAAVSSANPITNYQWDFDGNGTVDSSGPSQSTVSTTYTTPGLFTARVVATDSEGNQYAGSLPVGVLSFTALNALLQNRWNGFASALATQNIPGALAYFNPGFATQFSSVLTALSGQLPILGKSLNGANLLSMSGGVAEMVTIRSQQGSTHAYFIYFMQDANGFWKIVGM